MINVRPNKLTGGRIFECDTTYLLARVVDGVVEVWEPKEPMPPAAKPEPAPSHGPGSILKLAIKSITGEDPGPSCSCNKRVQRMNDWGWWGCWKRRREIAGWLAEEAAKRGHEVAPDRALSLLKAAWRESRGRG